MLDLFRQKGLSSFVYGFVILATAAIFVIQFQPNAGQKTASLKEACVVTVKGWCVDPKDYKAVYRLLMPRGPDGSFSQARARQMGLPRIVVDGLVERELLVSEADRLGLTVTEADVTESIYNGLIYVSVPSDRPELSFQFPVDNGHIDGRRFNYGGFRDPKTKQFDMKTYERTIRALMGRSATEFREEQTREILASRVRDIVRAPVRVSEDDALDAYVRERTTASVTYVPVKLSYAARYLVKATPAEVDAWAKDPANQELVQATLKGLPEGMQAKAGHIRHILIKAERGADTSDRNAAMNKLADALRRVQAGELFAEVAKAVSEDTGSGFQGGDVGDKTDPFVAPFKKAADALKPGELTLRPVETQFGYHILKKDDPDTFAKEVARSLYVKSKALEAAKALAATIHGQIKAGKAADEAVQAALADVAKNASAKWGPIEALREVEPDAGKPDAIFAREVTAEDDPSRPRAELAAGFNAGGDPLREASSDLNARIKDFAFAAKPGDVMEEPLRGDDALYVVALKERKEASREDFDKERDTYLERLLTERRAEALALYVKRLREAAKGEIRIDETYLAEPNRDGGAPIEDEEE
jgi:peptidyl-prolyl cis-trans isomerase D